MESNNLYTNMLMKNGNKYTQYGGNEQDQPTGGFPPIILCENKTVKSEEDKNRGFAPKKNTLSIQSILQKRRDKPFIAT